MWSQCAEALHPGTDALGNSWTVWVMLVPAVQPGSVMLNSHE